MYHDFNFIGVLAGSAEAALPVEDVRLPGFDAGRIAAAPAFG
ncbi:MAG: hypothetical protein QOJ91_2544 [Sphingomonadales bacterium]|nr:hypothetical protein [Sphingomonadales bacterium]